MTFSEFIKSLNAKEKKHLKKHGMTTIDALAKTFAWQCASRNVCPEIEPCWMCKSIAKKLGFKV